MYVCFCDCHEAHDIMSHIVKHIDILDLGISFLSFIATTILTVVIIAQTSRLAKKQSEQDLLINHQQEEWQRRQIRLDTFDHKLKIYHALYKVFQLAFEIEVISSEIKLREKTPKQLHALFSLYQEQLDIDVSETMWLFKQAEFILPSNISEVVCQIAEHFNELTGDIGKLNIFQTLLLPEEIEPEKQNLLDDISHRIREITRHYSFISVIMGAELDISTLEKKI